MNGAVIGSGMNGESTGGSSMSSHTGQEKKSSGTVGWLIGVAMWVAATLLWMFVGGAENKLAKWGAILLSEVTAAIAGMYLTKVLIGDQSRLIEPQSTEGTQATARIGSPKTTAVVSKQNEPTAVRNFFATRADPLTERLLKTQQKLALKEAEAERERQKRAGDQQVSASAAELAIPVEQPDKPKFDERLTQPEYAIGQGLISQSELNDLRNTYLAQSELSLGLIFPMLLMIFAVAYSLSVGWRQCWIAPLITMASLCLSLLAVERRQKYRIELGLLLVSRWDKQLAAEKETKPKPTPEDALRKVLKEELKQLQLEVKPLVVEVHQKQRESGEKNEPSERKEKPQPKPGDVY